MNTLKLKSDSDPADLALYSATAAALQGQCQSLLHLSLIHPRVTYPALLCLTVSITINVACSDCRQIDRVSCFIRSVNDRVVHCSGAAYIRAEVNDSNVEF